jgi:hypothetical protein
MAPLLLLAADGLTYGPFENAIARLAPIVVGVGVAYSLYGAVMALFSLMGGKISLDAAVRRIVGALFAAVFLFIVLLYWKDAANWLIGLVQSFGASAIDGNGLSLPSGLPEIPSFGPGGSPTPIPSIDPGFPAPPSP